MPPEVRAALRQFVASIAIAIAILLLIPFEPVFCSSDSTTGWPTRVAADLADGRRFGVDTVFSYGPLGVVPIRIYYPGAYQWLLLGWIVVSAALVAGCLRVLSRCSLAPIHSALLTLLIVAIVTSQFMRVGSEPVFLVLIALAPLLYLTRDETRSDARLELLLGLALAVASLGKFNYFIGAAGVIGALTLSEAVKRRTPRLALAFGASLLALWPATGQSFADLPEYLLTSVEISSGYTEAMSLETEARDGVVMLVLAAVIAIAVLFSSSRRANPGNAVGSSVGCTFWVFLVLKSALVRQDEHVLSASITFAAVGVLLIAISTRESPAMRCAAWMSTGLAFAAAVTCLVAFGASPGDELQRAPRAIATQAKAILRSARGSDWLGRRHEANLAALAAGNPVPRFAGSVDVLPYSSLLPWAHGLRYRAQPIVMSYVAYTPRLAELQARHLRMPDAPNHLLVAIDPIDGRYPSFDLGPSLFELLGRYEATAATTEFLVLSRRPKQRKLVLEPLATIEAQPGRTVEVPARPAITSPVWARVETHGGAARGIYSTFFRAPTIHIRVRAGDGRVIDRRFIPGSGEAGFLLSPYLEDQNSLALLFIGASDPGDAITALSIEAEPTVLPYARSFSIELFTIRMTQ